MKDNKPSIDYANLIRDIYKYRKLFYKVLSFAFLFACFICFSIPEYYECTVKLSPEQSGSKSTSSLASLASSFGVNLKGVINNTTEALFPTLYPEMMNSVDFKSSLFMIPVTIEGDKHKNEPDRIMTYYDYLENEWKRPWWSGAVIAVRDRLIDLFSEDEEKQIGINPFRLTRKQTLITKLIDKNIECDVDEKTLVISIKVTDQNPLICATMADSVKTHLQKFITDYRTGKARVDYEYYQIQCKEANARYDEACRKYVEFADGNRRPLFESTLQHRTKLQNEMEIQRGIYQQLISQLEQAEMRIQEDTPAFATLQSATVPIKKSGPNRKLIVLIILFVSFVGTSAFVLQKESDLESIIGFNPSVKTIKDWLNQDNTPNKH